MEVIYFLLAVIIIWQAVNSYLLRKLSDDVYKINNKIFWIDSKIETISTSLSDCKYQIITYGEKIAKKLDKKSKKNKKNSEK